MDIRLMGDVEIHDGSGPVPLSRAGERCVLASLALEPGRRIHVDTLIDRFWGDEPPISAVHTIASYVRTVRKAIEDAGGRRDWLHNDRPAFYQLRIEPGMVDYHRFTALVNQARTMERDQAPADAIGLYQQALRLRTAEALGNVTGQWAANRRLAIEQSYLDAAYALFAQQLTIGEYTAVASRATQLVMEVIPTDRMIELAIRGLAGSGQHAAIPGFLTRATRHMWDSAQARPGRQVFSIARELVANPNTPLPPHPLIGGGQPDEGDEGAVGGTDATQPEPVRRGHITMTAEHNQQVYQAAGDQYITGT